MSYIKPEDVTSPKKIWQLDKILYDGGEGKWSAAEGQWDGETVLAIRWNGSKDKPIGNPQSTGYPTWFIVPPKLEDAIRKRLKKFSKNRKGKK